MVLEVTLTESVLVKDLAKASAIKTWHLPKGQVLIAIYRYWMINHTCIIGISLLKLQKESFPRGR